MENKKLLTVKSFPTLVESFAKENLNIKVLCGILLALTFMALLMMTYLVKRGPTVVALSSDGEIAQIETKITDLQIIAAAKAYVGYRYNWTSVSISDRLKKAELFVQPSLVNAFEKSMVNVQKFVHDKNVSQRVYPKSVDVDLKSQTISIKADRITEFENLKAASEMTLKLGFKIDSRSAVNPWGVYITKESEGGFQ